MSKDVRQSGFNLPLPTPSLLAVATGVLGSAWASGAIASISIVGVPAAISVPGSSARVWAELFNRGIAFMPKFVAGVGAAYLFTAYETRKRQGIWKGFTVAAALVVSIVPYTLLFMRPTNEALHAIAGGAHIVAESEVTDLINKWGILNLGRSLLPLAGGVAGIVTFLGNL